MEILTKIVRLPVLFYCFLFLQEIHCTRVILYEKANGDTPHNIAHITPEICTNIPNSSGTSVQATQSLKIEGGTMCIKIWEFSDCRGRYRCICNHEKIHNLSDFGISPETVWSSVGVYSVSQCDYLGSVVTAVDVFDDSNYNGESIKILLQKNKCESLYFSDAWSNRISSIKVTKGCVQYFVNEECRGRYEQMWKNESMNNPEAEKKYIGVKWNDGIASMRACPTLEDGLETDMQEAPLALTLKAELNLSCSDDYKYQAIDCSTYYTCINFTRKELHRCSPEDGLAFNPTLGVCDAIGSVAECNSSLENWTAKMDPMKPEKTCRSEYRSNLEDCRKFYFCRNSCEEEPVQEKCEERTCPEGLLWTVDMYGDGTSHQQCTLAHKAVCAGTDPKLAFSCGELPNGNYKNDADCHSFWKCVNERPLLYVCPEDSVFHPEMEKCVPPGKAMEYC